MKTRIISALLLLLIILPIIIKGGSIYVLAVLIISLLALKEFIETKELKKKFPLFIKYISYFIMSLIVLNGVGVSNLNFSIDFRIIAGLSLVYLVPTVLYYDKDKYNISDALYLLGGVFFLGTSFYLMIVIRYLYFDIIIYLLLLVIFTDTFAYLTGTLIGRTKLLEKVSPKKTWEGLIGGTIMGVFVSMMFYLTVINANINIIILLLVTIFLSLLGQFGDLVFSSIKRYYEKKDFSNIIPGHGGILDRLDNIIFVVLGFVFVMTLL